MIHHRSHYRISTKNGIDSLERGTSSVSEKSFFLTEVI